MSIIQTNLQRQHIETPTLKTNEIVYLGHELPFYDNVTRNAIGSSIQQKRIEKGKTDSYQDATTRYIKLFINNSVFSTNGVFYLNKTVIHFAERQTNTRQFIKLCVYALKDGQYIYLGESRNAFINPVYEAEMGFEFDNLELFERVADNKLLPYEQIYLKAHITQIDEDGLIIGDTGEHHWSDSGHIEITIKGCDVSSSSYTPCVLNDDNTITPHIVLEYKDAIYQIDGKVLHNSNNSVHISDADREKIDKLIQLGDSVLVEEQYLKFDVDTRKAKNYNRTNDEVLSSFYIDPKYYISQTIESIKVRRNPSFNPDSLLVDKWMQADCFNSAGTIIDTYLSTNSNTQRNGDGGETIWYFEGFKILKEYAKIEIRFSNSGTERQTVYIKYAGGSLRNSSGNNILYDTEWKTSWAQNGNVSDIRVQNFTSDFVINVKPLAATGKKFIQHLTDTSKHITEDERNKINQFLQVTNDEIIEHDINVRNLINDFTSFGAEGIIGFTMTVDQSQHGLIIDSIDLPRIDNNNLNSNSLYIYGQCFDQNNNEIDDGVFFSTNPETQTANDDKTMSWQFDDFIIPKLCSKIKFFFSTSKGQKQRNNEVRTSVLVKNNSKLYYQGWQTIWKGDAYKDFTTVFVLHLHEKIPSILQHAKNLEIHVTQQDRQKINQIDTIKSSVTTVNNSLTNHAQSTTFHLQSGDRNNITRAINHVDTNSIHVSAADREKWNNKVDSKTLDDRFDELQKIFDITPKEKIRNTKDIFFKDNNGTAARIHAWDLKTAEYVGEYLTQVTIYRPTDIAYIDSSDILHNNPQKLSVECLDVNNNLIDTYFSIDSDSQKDGDDNTTTWNFNEIIIKEEYNKLRFRVTTQDGVLENQPQSTKRAILCYTYTNIPDTNDWGLIEQNNTVQAGHTMYFQFKTITKQQNFAAHVTNDDIHVSAADREKWNNNASSGSITYTAGNGIEITNNTISVITTDVIEESNKIPTAKVLYNTFYGTRNFNNYDTSKYTAAGDTVGTIVLSKKHFIKDCKITKFAIPHDKNIDNGEGGYLVIEVFAEDLSKTDGYDKANPIHRYYSDNYYAYKMNTQYGKYEWTFNNTECLIPSDYKVVHLSLVTNNTIVPSVGSANNNKLRINCLAKNDNRDEGVVYEEDDECTLYWKGSTSGANRVAIVQAEFIGNKLDDFSIVPMLLERIAALEARVSELENS